MSISETPTPQPAPVARPSRLRRVLVGGALVLSGVIVGIGTTAISQDYRDSRGWHDGARGHYDRRDDDGDRRGWRDEDRGPRGMRGMFGRDEHRAGWHGGPHVGGMGGQFLTPGRIERVVERGLGSVDASTDQKQKVTTILRGAADDLYKLRQQHLDGRRQIREVLGAATVDRAKLEELRGEQMKLADAASKRITTAVADAGEVLTPAQRAELGKRFDDHARWFNR